MKACTARGLETEGHDNEETASDILTYSPDFNVGLSGAFSSPVATAALGGATS